MCIKTKNLGHIKDTCKVTVLGKSFNVSVNEFADWNPEIKDSVSISSINSDKVQPVNHEDGLSDYGFTDKEDGEIPNFSANEEVDRVKNTQWDEDNDFGNSKPEKKETSSKDNPETPVEDSKTFSKPPGFEAFNSNSNNSCTRKSFARHNQSSHCSSAPVKSSRINNSHTNPLSKHGSMIEALVSQIEMGKVLGYDMEGRANKCKSIAKLCIKHKISFLGIQETHISKLNPFKVKSIWGNSQFEFAECPSIGRSGGLVSVWDSNAFSKNKVFQFDNFIVVKNVSGLVLDCHISDHRPILLEPITTDFGPTPFKFYNSWLLDKNLHSCVNEFWTSYNSCNIMNPIIHFKNKMKALKIVIKDWSANRSNLLPFVADYQRLFGLIGYRQIEVNESLDSNQKAKVKWCAKADENSKFFYAIVNQRRRYLAIQGIKGWFIWIVDPLGIKDAFISFFEKKFKHMEVIKVVNRSPFYKSLTNDQSSFLDSPISSNEIKAAIWDCGSDKSPGPDGFTFAFYKEFWNTIKDDVVTFVHHFFATGSLPRASGLKINYHKSKLFGVGVSPNEISALAATTGCSPLASSFNYLGLPVDCNMSRVKSWDPIVEKFSSRLSRWRASLLSFGGRATLISSVLGALGTYFFSLFPMPSLVDKKLESIRAKFFWGSTDSSHKVHWIRWKDVLASKDKGGLGIGSLYALNQALILKWRWRFLTNPHALWARLITAIYGHNKDPTSFFSHIKSKGVWSRIVGSINHLHEKNYIRLSSMKRQVNNGATTSFWYDSWADSSPLKSLFPRLFHLATNKDSSNMISSIILNDSEDTWTWSLGGNFFTVRSARCQIDGEFLPDQGHSTRWNQIIPKKVNIFVWRASRDRLPSRWNLSRRGIEVNSLNCPICDAGTETSFHTLWACSLASLVWIRVFKWVDLFIPTISSLSDLFIWIDDSTLPGLDASVIAESASALSSASVELLETTGCFFECQEIKLLPRNTPNPETGLLESEQLAQSLSQYACKYEENEKTGSRLKLQRPHQ
ncbi:RNA-directed DNA polymerase, eukaryota, reverse transcriptase zinc-binding domain protein, partial [Tanacetum coccineum]